MYRRAELDSAEALLNRARSLAESVGDRRTALNAVNALGSVAKDRGDLRRAQVLYASALDLRSRIGDMRGTAADHNNLGLLSAELGEIEDARSHYEEALAVARRHAHDEAAATALLNLGNAASIEASMRRLPVGTARRWLCTAVPQTMPTQGSCCTTSASLPSSRRLLDGQSSSHRSAGDLRPGGDDGRSGAGPSRSGVGRRSGRRFERGDGSAPACRTAGSRGNQCRVDRGGRARARRPGGAAQQLSGSGAAVCARRRVVPARGNGDRASRGAARPGHAVERAAAVFSRARRPAIGGAHAGELG